MSEVMNVQMKLLKNIVLGAVVAAALVLLPACAPTGTAASGGAATVAAPDPANATFTVEKSSVTLTNGRAEKEAAPGSASKIVTVLSDKRATGDVDGDGRADTIVVLTQQPGGSGTFYYVAVLLNGAGGVTATPAMLLGDRIAVNGVRLDGSTIVVDLLDRASGQPFTASPSVAVAKRFAVAGGALQPR
jgi:hypothetical protein